MIIRLNNNEKENVLKHIFQGYILPKDKQGMIYKKGHQVDNHFGKGGEEIYDVTHTIVFG